MARRTATITQLRYYKKNARAVDKHKDVGRLPDGGDLLTFVYAVWNGLRPRDLHDRSKLRYCDPHNFIAQGRTLTLSAMAGTYGDPGSVRNVDTGEEHLVHEGDLTNAVPLRLAVFVPPRGTSALMTIEHSSGIPALGGRFLDHLKLCWDQRYPEWTLKPTAMTRPDAWLENAQLEAVTAEVYNHKTSIEDTGLPHTMGVLTSTLAPKKGSRYLPRELLDLLAGSAAQRAALMGMREEPDEVKVRLGDGDQARTFVLGKDRTPAIRLLVTDYADETMSDDAFRRWSGAEVSSHFRTVGVDWNASMLDGTWAPEALRTKVALDDGR